MPLHCSGSSLPTVTLTLALKNLSAVSVLITKPSEYWLLVIVRSEHLWFTEGKHVYGPLVTSCGHDFEIIKYFISVE